MYHNLSHKNLRTIILSTFLIFSAFSSYAQDLKEGITAMNRGKDEQAKSIFKSLISKDTKNAEAYYLLGVTYLNSDQKDSAYYYFKTAMDAKSGDPYPYIGTARAQMEEGKIVDAKSNIDKALALSMSKNPRVLAEASKAFITMNKKNPELAIELINKAKVIDPKNVDYILIHGDALIEKGDGGEAAKLYESANKMEPKNPLTFYALGKLYRRARSYDIAKENFEKVLQLDPQFAVAYSDLGDLAYNKKNLDEATAQYKKYVDLVGDNVNARIRYASFLFLKKDYQGVESEIEIIRKKDKTNPQLTRLLGYAQYERARYPESRTTLEEYFRTISPEKIISTDYEFLAKAYDKTGSDSLSLINYKKAVDMDSSKFELYGVMSDKALKLRKYPEAIQYLRAKLKTTKTKIGDTYSLGKAYYSAKMFEQADSAFAYVIQESPNTITAIVWRARVGASKDPNSTAGFAKPYYDDFIVKSNGDVSKYKSELLEAYDYNLFYYYQKKDDVNAKININRALSVDGTNSQALQLKKYYEQKAKAAANPGGKSSPKKK